MWCEGMLSSMSASAVYIKGWVTPFHLELYQELFTIVGKYITAVPLIVFQSLFHTPDSVCVCSGHIRGDSLYWCKHLTISYLLVYWCSKFYILSSVLLQIPFLFFLFHIIVGHCNDFLKLHGQVSYQYTWG